MSDVSARKQRLSIRTDPALRALAVAGMGLLAASSLLMYRAGLGEPSVVSYACLLFLGVIAFGLIPWSAWIDAGSLRIKGLNQQRIPLTSIRDVRRAGRFVEVVWLDSGRERSRRVYPKDADAFIAWLRLSISEAALAA